MVLDGIQLHISLCALLKKHQLGYQIQQNGLERTNTHTHNVQCYFLYVCVCVREGYGVNLLSVTFSLWLQRQKKFYYSTGERPGTVDFKRCS